MNVHDGHDHSDSVPLSFPPSFPLSTFPPSARPRSALADAAAESPQIVHEALLASLEYVQTAHSHADAEALTVNVKEHQNQNHDDNDNDNEIKT